MTSNCLQARHDVLSANYKLQQEEGETVGARGTIIGFQPGSTSFRKTSLSISSDLCDYCDKNNKGVLTDRSSCDCDKKYGKVFGVVILRTVCLPIDDDINEVIFDLCNTGRQNQ